MFFFQAVNADPKLSFSDTLSTDNFILYLRQEGLSDKDCKKMRGNILCTLSDLLTASNITQSSEWNWTENLCQTNGRQY